MRMEQSTEHTRAYIKIQDGCNQFCSYCIIPFVRGRVRSRKQEDVLAEVRGLAEKGFQEVVITGIHLSSYGMDFIGETDGDYLKNGKDLRGTAFERAYLVSLLEEIAKVDGIRRIRLVRWSPVSSQKSLPDGWRRFRSFVRIFTCLCRVAAMKRSSG